MDQDGSTITAYLDHDVYGDDDRVVYLAKEDIQSVLELQEIGQQTIVTYIK